MKVSILGCGWFGKPLGAALVKGGHDVKGSTTSKSKVDALAADGIIPFVLRLSPELQGERVEDFFQCDVLVASVPPKSSENGSQFFYQQLEAIVECMRRFEVRRIMFVSSTSVYPNTNGTVSESDFDEDSDMYRAEEILRNEKDLLLTVLRFGGLVGPARHPGKFLAGREVKGGNEPVNIVHLDDCIAIANEVIARDVWNETFNVCADLHPSRRDFYTSASAALALPPPRFSGAGMNFKIVSNKKVRERLNYQFKFPDPLRMIDDLKINT